MTLSIITQLPMSLSPESVVGSGAMIGTRPEEAKLFLARQPWCIVLNCPEITLKGRNQGDFRRALVKNVEYRLHRADYSLPVHGRHGRICVEAGPYATDARIKALLALLSEVTGVSSLVPAIRVSPRELYAGQGKIDWRRIEALTVALARVWCRRQQSFAVRARITDKSLPVRARDIEVRLGSVIRHHSDWCDVNLDAPDRTFWLRFHSDGLYIFTEKYPGIGGLPSGTGGRMLALLSGGIDSPVAAFQVARRGAGIDFFHMSAAHTPGEGLADSVVGKLAARLSRYALHTRLFVAPYTFFDLALKGPPDGYELTLFRRFLIRAAERLAARIGAGALVTGDCLGQVASQTLENIATTDEAARLPILRPLIGTNKNEIIEQAQRIGTYSMSIEPYKDCCALLAAHPRTRTRPGTVAQVEAARLPDYEQVLERTLNETLCIEYDCGEVVRRSSLSGMRT